MLKLHGFSVSNYYNMAKFALLEKGLAFDEVSAMPSQEADYKAKSPMGKVPCIETDKGGMRAMRAASARVFAINSSSA